MDKLVAQQLVIKAKEAANAFSNPDRAFYKTGKQEYFEYEKAIPLSEATAIVYLKKDTGKRALLFFYYIKNYGQDDSGNPTGRWLYFFPTDSHLLGMREVEKFKQELEVENFKYNFEVK